jgi:hypothetical protein
MEITKTLMVYSFESEAFVLGTKVRLIVLHVPNTVATGGSLGNIFFSPEFLATVGARKVEARHHARSLV